LMEPRFLIKTHAQVSNPGIFSVLICKCTSADKGTYPETIARRLAELFQQERISFKAAAKFAVLMAEKLGFLSDNMAWTWKGHVIHVALAKVGKTEASPTSDFLRVPFSELERALYLRYYLEGEGAIIFKIMEALRQYGSLTMGQIGARIQDMFQEIYQAYMSMLPGVRGRERLKLALERLHRERYKPGTVPHKVRPHVQPLIDLGILTASDEEAVEPVVVNGSLTSDIFVDEYSDLTGFERAIQQERYFTVISRLLGIQGVTYHVEVHRGFLRAALLEGYRKLRSSSTGMAHLNSLWDWVCLDLLVSQRVIIERDMARRQIEALFHEVRHGVRYHVDYRGMPTYVILEEKAW
jgi:hypothetical protein